jgi:hypothetical protein
MHTSNIFVPEHFDCMKGLSTENAVFKLPENVLRLLQKVHVGEFL